MANNRMYLRCRACGEKFFLGKHFCRNWYLENYREIEGGSIQEQLNKFYSEHIYCKGRPLECFDIVYEDPEPSIWTNADRIRSMSDEELAQFIWNRDIDIVEKSSVVGQFTFTVDREKCFKNVLDWLKAEVE